jgi:hypothetical protein
MLSATSKAVHRLPSKGETASDSYLSPLAEGGRGPSWTTRRLDTGHDR